MSLLLDLSCGFVVDVGCGGVNVIVVVVFLCSLMLLTGLVDSRDCGGCDDVGCVGCRR